MPGHALGAGMGAVGGGEGVVHIDIAQLRELRGKGGVVCLLAGVEAGVFQHQHIAVIQAGHRVLGLGADAIRRERHRLAKHAPQRLGNRLQRHFRHDFALRPVEMAEHDDFRALAGEFLDRRHETLKPRRVGDLAVLHRHVQVGAEQHALPRDIGVIERLAHSAPK